MANFLKAVGIVIGITLLWQVIAVCFFGLAALGGIIHYFDSNVPAYPTYSYTPTPKPKRHIERIDLRDGFQLNVVCDSLFEELKDDESHDFLFEKMLDIYAILKEFKFKDHATKEECTLLAETIADKVDIPIRDCLLKLVDNLYQYEY